MLQFDNIKEMLEARAAYSVTETYQMVNDVKAPKKVKENELFTMDIVQMTRHHLISSIFALSIERMDGFQFKDKNIRPHLDLLIRLFAIN